jgi:hypothetical protein
MIAMMMMMMLMLMVGFAGHVPPPTATVNAFDPQATTV